ncbi:hypothetical protein CEXT_479101 [Caerostris extrusa]|uniref:Uncharacterized protein n=1 Tax=Caerostris extrusa TaxID=172846 RepID=A0AAV4UM36_CAEEX|nr:hypothetical protein CEXT_479101 [Caerostris extrusa]
MTDSVEKKEFNILSLIYPDVSKDYSTPLKFPAPFPAATKTLRTRNTKINFQTTLRHSSLLTPSLYNSLKLYDKLKTHIFFHDHYTRRTFFPPRKIFRNDSMVTAFGAPHLCCRKFTPFPPPFIGGLNRSQPSLNSDLRGHKQ